MSAPPPSPSPTTQASRPATVAFNNCFNEHPCCSHWASEGECSRNPDFMESQCQPSCNQCRPSFDLSNECSDHHASCRFWSSRGECQKNAYWMEENCRESCGLCHRSRMERCQRRETNTVEDSVRAAKIAEENDFEFKQRETDRKTSVSMSSRAQSNAKCEVTECYNENKCCDEWQRQGECEANAEWMRCNCKVSCGVCQPNFSAGTCGDYHNKCRGWMERGECSKNPWMLENCKDSCETCRKFPKEVLRKECDAHV